MSDKKTNGDPTRNLAVISQEEVKKELQTGTSGMPALDPGEEKDLDAKADGFVKQLIEFSPGAMDQEVDRKRSVEQMGIEAQKDAARRSEMLKQPLTALSRRAEDGGEVANALIGLKMKVEELDPGKFDFEAGWFSRTLGRLPGVGTPIKRYFSKFESAQTVIQSIIRSLKDGKERLLRDNVTLSEDQKLMRECTHKLDKAIRLGQLIDQKIQHRLEREIPVDDPRHRFISEELLFPLRQRVMDLQQQLVVNQQGVLAAEIIIRNNKELARGVDRSLMVTVTALEVGATVALALANQKIVLEKIDAVSKTTSDLIAGTAARLKTQGVEIHKQASSAQLNIESLKAAFADIRTAMEDISNFRVQALPGMAASVLELDKLSRETEKTIRKMEEGNQAKPALKIDVD
ncbi:MAG: toxic anion resistance protein [Bdellovibrionales bacterium]|nr:toxic anion resistance protein [Bdellovibrionales bacterium]